MTTAIWLLTLLGICINYITCLTAATFCTSPKEYNNKILEVDCISKQNFTLANSTKWKSFPSFCSIKVQCNRGYAYRNKIYALSNCVSGVWEPPIPPCKRVCHQLKPVNVDLKCYNGNESIPCNTPLLSGTKVVPECKPKYRAKTFVNYRQTTCRKNGDWSNPLFTCEPECGIVSEKLNPLIAYGNKTQQGESPWHTAIYWMRSEGPVLICGGTIVSQRAVISAAHCFYDIETSALNHKSQYRVVVGKVTRDYNTTDNAFQQSFRIKEIKYHESGFHGDATNYLHDIAILILKKKINFNEMVRPACIDWTSSEFNSRGIALGKVSGWGYTENETQPEVLLSTTTLQYLSQSECIAFLPMEHKNVVAADKFCVKSDRGSSLQKGDSGGGLLFLDTYNSIYYLRGVVSNNLQPIGIPLTLFTDVSKYLDWISTIINNDDIDQLSQKPQPESFSSCILPERIDKVDNIECDGASVSFLDELQEIPHSCVISFLCKVVKQDIYKSSENKITCMNGTWYPELTDCSNVTAEVLDVLDADYVKFEKLLTPECGIAHDQIPPSQFNQEMEAYKNWPWLVTFDQRNGGFVMGVLISREWILTSAYAIPQINHQNVTNAHLDVGFLLNGTGATDVPIKRIVLHPEYSAINIHHNLALIKLETPIQYSNNIRPICLITEQKLLTLPASSKENAIFTGYYGYGLDLYNMKVNILSTTKCYEMDHFKESFYSYSDSELCTHYCWGRLGGPIATYDYATKTYYLRGIFSYRAKGSACTKNQSTAAYYQNIPYYINWIIQTIFEG